MEAVLGVEVPTREDGAERLVRRYFAAFGPATQQDLLRFAGIRVSDVRAGLERVELRTFRDERGRVLLDLPRGPLPDPRKWPAAPSPKTARLFAANEPWPWECSKK